MQVLRPEMARSLQDRYQEWCRHLSDHADVKQISADFAKIDSNVGRVDKCLRVMEDIPFDYEYAAGGKDDEAALDAKNKGNEAFRKKEDNEALEFYTRSLAYSETNLGVAFANRSAVLFQHGLFGECLRDIQYATENKIPENVRTKLEARKEKALKLMEAQMENKVAEEIPSVSKQPHELIQSASTLLEISESDQEGRFVLTKEDLKVGDVLAVEKPFAAVLLPTQYLTHCYHCLKPSYNLIPCESCPHVLFCCGECKQKAWDSYHKFECPILGRLLDLQLPKLVMLALRVSLMAKKDFKNLSSGLPNFSTCSSEEPETRTKGEYKSDRYEEIHNLVGNTKFRHVADLFTRAFKAAFLYKIVKEYSNFFEENYEEDVFKEVLLHHLQTGPSNFHQISELCGARGKPFRIVEIGAGAYSFLSLLNHSCNPNVTRHCYGSTIVMRALRPLKAGSQLFDNYG